MFCWQIDRRVVKKAKKAGAEEEEEEGVADEGAEEVESGENSVSVMARLTKHIYNYQVVDNDRWVWLNLAGQTRGYVVN